MMLPAALHDALTAPASLTVALSGGIDSLTLSAAAALARGADGVTLCHAVSPAVPAAATARVHEFAAARGLTLKLVQSGEFDDPSYRANPVNRCYFCKVNLYGTLSRMGDVVAAGTNTDDLSDYRPGLIAAEEHNVIHPFVAADMAKSDVRALARVLGLGDLADLLRPRPVWRAGFRPACGWSRKNWRRLTGWKPCCGTPWGTSPCAVGGCTAAGKSRWMGRCSTP